LAYPSYKFDILPASLCLVIEPRPRSPFEPAMTKIQIQGNLTGNFTKIGPFGETLLHIDSQSMSVVYLETLNPEQRRHSGRANDPSPDRRPPVS
jgi:hypothetical protein